MDIYEQIRRFDDLIEYVTNELPIFAQQVTANDLAAAVSSRVIDQGLNFKGQPFSPYSKKTIPAFRFWGKSRTQAAEKKVRDLARNKGALSYDGFRGLNNLRTGTKNFEFTGEMWRKFGIVRTNLLGERFTISLGGTTTAAQTKIDENSEREGVSIIEASADDEKLVQRTTQGWLDRNAERILNG